MRVCEACNISKPNNYFPTGEAVCRRCQQREKVERERIVRSIPAAVSAEIDAKWERFRRRLRPLPSEMLADLRARNLI